MMAREKRKYDQQAVDDIMGIRCPWCDSEQLVVSRTIKLNSKIIRYRKCRVCAYQFATEEKMKEE